MKNGFVRDSQNSVLSLWMITSISRGAFGGNMQSDNEKNAIVTIIGSHHHLAILAKRDLGQTDQTASSR